MERYALSEKLLERALKAIPLGSQTFSKSVTQYPRGASPHFLIRGRGSHVWDADGNEYIDFVNGLLAVSIGYDDPVVTDAVREQLEVGVSFSLPHPIEVEVAELLIDLVPCAEMVRFGKNGTDVTSAAIRLARAHTGRDHVALCGYHGWQDWSIGSTTRDLGVPSAVKALSHTFQYNDIDSVHRIFREHPGNVAAVIMEPMNVEWPAEGFLEAVKELAHEEGALFIFDEIITGCRFSRGGAQELFGVVPDLATLGKGLGNGFPISAIVGRVEVMRGMEDIFFSGTFGGEAVALAATRAVLGMVKNGQVVERLAATGQAVLDGVGGLLEKHGVSDLLRISGHPAWSLWTFQDMQHNSSWEIKTLFLQEMFKRGVLTMGGHNISCAHTMADVERLLQVYDEVFPLLLEGVAANSVSEFLDGETLEPLFRVR